MCSHFCMNFRGNREESCQSTRNWTTLWVCCPASDFKEMKETVNKDSSQRQDSYDDPPVRNHPNLQWWQKSHNLWVQCKQAYCQIFDCWSFLILKYWRFNPIAYCAVYRMLANILAHVRNSSDVFWTCRRKECQRSLWPLEWELAAQYKAIQYSLLVRSLPCLQ